MSEELLNCPFCDRDKFTVSAFSISDECHLSCKCGLILEKVAPWKENETEEEHDRRCYEVLKKAWNTRATPKIDRERLIEIIKNVIWFDECEDGYKELADAIIKEINGE